METSSCFNLLRRSVLASIPLSERAITELLKQFTLTEIQADTLFCKAGEYHSSFAFVCQGILIAFYQDSAEKIHVKSFFPQHRFLLPLPSFIYRSPVFINYKAITSCKLLVAKYSGIESLFKTYPQVQNLLRQLIDKEWIIDRVNYEAALFNYNTATRYRLLNEFLGSDISLVPSEFVASYLQISIKQLDKYIARNQSSRSDER